MSMVDSYGLLESNIPTPFRTDSEWAMIDALLNNPELTHHLPEHSLKAADIIPTQHGVDADIVARFQENGWEAPILVVALHGEHYCLDGHHRLAATPKRGFIAAFVLTLPENQAIALIGLLDQLKVARDELLSAMHPEDRAKIED